MKIFGQQLKDKFIKQYGNCNDLWASIKASCESQAEMLIPQLIGSMDNRIFQLFEKKGGITKH